MTKRSIVAKLNQKQSAQSRMAPALKRVRATTGKGETRWETKARRIRTKVRNKRQTNRTKNQKISWPSNRKENLERS
jgi:hypothetical protein